MLIIFPTGHEETHARRWPWITIALVVTNLFLFVVFGFVQERAMQRQAEAPLNEAVEYLQEHPYLHPPRLIDAFLTDKDRKSLAANREALPAFPEAEQVELERLAAEAHTALERLPSFRFGYRPGEPSLFGLLSHQFMHGGWLHLLGNMWFLWLCGYILEDAWGRLAFPGFYLCAGVLAALAHHLANIGSPFPLIGASGAIAGVMGAFLVRNARTKIRFFAWVLVRPLRFSAPAFVVLPLWFAEQLVWGMRQQDGVAYWAHVGGFVFGVGGALALRWGGYEQRLVRAIEERGVVREDPEIAAAAALIDGGRAVEAVARLQGIVARAPRRIDAWLELLRASTAAGDPQRELEVKLKLIELYLQEGAGDAAASLYLELAAEKRAALVPAAVRLRLARHYERAGQAMRAWSLFEELHAGESVSDWRVAGAALLAHAELALKLGRKEDAVALFERAEARGDPELVSIVKQGLARAQGL